ncbi:MAG: disulfide bond formation protein B [Gammaproteobacteria bacterium]|nr:disulfide bond formation protein B [Gammaproteobacteria bacterium]
MKIIKLLSQLSHNKGYWLFYIAGSLGLLAMALYSQYINEEQPCVMCIQVRLLLSLLIVVAIFGLLTRDKGLLNHLSNLSVVLVAGVLVERSYMLLGTERGFIFSDCGFDAGLPAWFQLDVWLPWLYGIETSCGYTPEIIFGVTMAESLIVISVGLMVFSAIIFVLGMVKPGADK